VFVDAVQGLGSGDQVEELAAGDVAALAPDAHHHGAGLPYLLRVLPLGCEGPLPELRVVGIEGAPDPAVVDRAANLALRLATEQGRP